jgi:DNA invertase Pin-like site-specific DNA recombinase
LRPPARKHRIATPALAIGVVAEFETNLRRERQMEGIAAAKSRGVFKGRKPHVDVVEIHRLRSEGMGPTEIAKTLNIDRASVYRALREAASS